jgi:class 3 adenylate cyclase
MATQEQTGSDRSLRAKEALEAHQWDEAFDLLSRAPEADLSAEDLEGLAEAAWFTAHADLALEAKERAHQRYLERGDTARAAFLAFDVGHEYGLMRKFSIGSAWFKRGERLLEGEPEGYAHGYLALSKSWVVQSTGDVDGAIKFAGQAVELGARYGDHDLQAWGLLQKGSILITIGRMDEGFPLMEEATVAAVNGELSPFTTGVVYCQMIATCRNTTDYRRASEWTEAARRWCERQAINGFPGICRVHRAEIEGLQGGFERAARELEQATEELGAYHATPPLADGFYALGEVRFRMGDLQSAEDALRRAHALGRTPHPALALLRLREGNLKAAVTAINSAVADLAWDRWTTARLLPAQIEIALAAGDLSTARAAAENLAGLTQTYDSPALHASRHEGCGRLHLAEGDADQAIGELRNAIRDWQEVGAPYEVARVRVVLAAACRRLGRDDEADLELETAREEFARLGAVLDLAATKDAIRAEAERRAGPDTARKTFVFTDIVSSTTLAEALGDVAWEHLLRWHDETLRVLVARHGGEVVNSTGDGLFVAFNSPKPALDWAVSVQRALAEHRRTTGFAPAVRIGVHSADANRRGKDYSGKGVHVAARIAALAEGGQVLTSLGTVQEAGVSYPSSDPRSVTLKGVSEPVDVVTLGWN